MNGEFQELYHEIDKRLTVMETLQKERHIDNKKDLNELFIRFRDIPCKAHEAKINIMYGLVTIMVSGCVGGFWWLLRR